MQCILCYLLEILQILWYNIFEVVCLREKSQRFDSRQIMKNEKFEVFHYKEPKRTDVELHDHDFYEIYFLLNGDVSYWIEGQTYHLEPGSILLINPQVLHRPIVSENSKVYERIVLWINKKYLDDFAENLSECFFKVNSNKNYIIKLTEQYEISELTSKFSTLIKEYYTENYANELYAKSIFIQILIDLNRVVEKSKEKTHSSDKQSKMVSKIISYIDENYKNNISLDDLSEKFYISKYHLSHEFSREVGIGVYRYILLKRLTIAKQMILDGKNATQVCFECGFNDYTNFYRAFKTEYGISPRQIKR